MANFRKSKDATSVGGSNIPTDGNIDGTPGDGGGVGTTGIGDEGIDDTINGLNAIEPTDLDGDDQPDHTGEPGNKRKHRTKRKSGGKWTKERREQASRSAKERGFGSSPQTKTSNDLKGIEKVLYSIHQMAAAIVGVPEFAIDEAESKTLAEAVTNVSKHYPIGMDEKTVAWCNLAMVASGMYGTRFFAYRMRMRNAGQLRVMPPAPAQPPASPGGPAPAPGAAAPNGSAGLQQWTAAAARMAPQD
jgi:hypothetical protein